MWFTVSVSQLFFSTFQFSIRDEKKGTNENGDNMETRKYEIYQNTKCNSFESMAHHKTLLMHAPSESSHSTSHILLSSKTSFCESIHPSHQSSQEEVQIILFLIVAQLEGYRNFWLNPTKMVDEAGGSWTPIYFLLASVYIWLFSSREDENKIAKNLFKKISITISSLIFMVLSKDSKGVGPKYNPDPELIKGDGLTSKTVIFVR